MSEQTDARLAEISEKVDLILEEMEARRARLERCGDLVTEAAPVLEAATGLATRTLSTLEDRGYAGFGRAGVGVVDRVVTSFDEEDVEALGENIVLILDTIRQMTQPEIMTMLRRTVATVHDDGGPPPSLLALLGRLREPAVRRGLARLIAVLGSLGEEGPLDTTTKRGER